MRKHLFTLFLGLFVLAVGIGIIGGIAKYPIGSTIVFGLLTAYWVGSLVKWVYFD